MARQGGAEGQNPPQIREDTAFRLGEARRFIADYIEGQTDVGPACADYMASRIAVEVFSILTCRHP